MCDTPKVKSESHINPTLVNMSFTTSTLSRTDYNIYLTEEISTPDQYIEIYDALNRASEYDSFTIYLNGYGGVLSSTIQLISSLQNTAAQVTTVMAGDCLSAMGMIFLSGDYHIIYPGTEFMCHQYSGGIGGKGHEMESRAGETNSRHNAFMEKVYRHFLTEKEMKKMFKGKEYYFSDEEVIKRLAIRKEKYKEEEAEAEAEAEENISEE